MEASGKLAGTIVFSRWKGRPVVRQLVTPHNPKSAKQVSMRACLGFLSHRWAGIEPANQNTWAEAANARKISTFNAYTSTNQAAWRNFLPPSISAPPRRNSPSGTAPTVNVTPGVRQVTVDIIPGTLNDTDGYVIFRALGEEVTPSISSAIAMIPTITGYATYVDTPLDPGEYHYKVQPFSSDGMWGTASIDRDVVLE
jgi:hypothetical protein